MRTKEAELPKRPVVLLHGYSDRGASFEAWRNRLLAAGYSATAIHLAEYVSLSNEVTVKDIAEGLDRALRAKGMGDQPFDAIVHSNGGLVIREWLASYRRRERLKHLVCLAPAMFGSPLAHRGRSWIGALFKGNTQLGPDFLEAGDRVLSALELGSAYTWHLAHRDMLADPPVFGEGNDTPYPFVIIGAEGYGGTFRQFINEPGTDGTVRWAGAALATRKLRVDLTEDRLRAPGSSRLSWEGTGGIDAPLAILSEYNHGSILREPNGDLVEMVFEALAVDNMSEFNAWVDRWGTKREYSADRRRAVGLQQWQQFIVHVTDERGDPVNDWYVEVCTPKDDGWVAIDDDLLNVHAYSEDPSYRAIHIRIDDLDHKALNELKIRIRADSGTELIAYHGCQSEVVNEDGSMQNTPGFWHAQLELTEFLKSQEKETSFFYPWTTTLIEICLNREPMPPGETAVNRVLYFVDDATAPS
jgi:hypothetical protein